MRAILQGRRPGAKTAWVAVRRKADGGPKEPVVKKLPSYVTPSDLAASSDEVRQAYATWKDAPPVELYDLENDPYEFRNLAGQPEFADVQKRLLAQLESWRQQTNDPLTDPAKLARLTREQDAQAEKYTKGSRSGAWEYHQYLYDVVRPTE